MKLARVGIVLLCLLAECFCGPYPYNQKNFNKASSYHAQRIFNNDELFFGNFYPTLQENSREINPTSQDMSQENSREMYPTSHEKSREMYPTSQENSRENSYESRAYYYPPPKKSRFSYEDLSSGEDSSSSRESNEVKPEKLQNDEHIRFSYDEGDHYGPSHWGEISANCDGKSQSPVHIRTCFAHLSESVRPLIIDNFDSLPSLVTAINNGHSSVFKFKYPNDKPARLLGGPLKVAYNLDNIHFHWGESDLAGSEHLLNSRSYSAEVHFVTYNSNYASLAEASTQSKGLAVLAFFYKLDNRNGATNNPFVNLLSKITEPESSYNETQQVFSIRDLIKKNRFRFISYKGSLTTPNCLETVTWLVATKPLKISSAELAEFRKIKDDTGKLLTHNVRPIQKLNKRRLISY